MMRTITFMVLLMSSINLCDHLCFYGGNGAFISRFNVAGNSWAIKFVFQLYLPPCYHYSIEILRLLAIPVPIFN